MSQHIGLMCHQCDERRREAASSSRDHASPEASSAWFRYEPDRLAADRGEQKTTASSPSLRRTWRRAAQTPAVLVQIFP